MPENTIGTVGHLYDLDPKARRGCLAWDGPDYDPYPTRVMCVAPAVKLLPPAFVPVDHRDWPAQRITAKHLTLVTAGGAL